jgi:hypothetical protein
VERQPAVQRNDNRSEEEDCFDTTIETQAAATLGDALGPASAATADRADAPRSAVVPTTWRKVAVMHEVLWHGPTEVIAKSGDCLLVAISETLSATGVGAIRRGFEEIASEHARFGYLSHVDGKVGASMDSRARKLMADVVGRHSPRIAAAAIAVSGQGFRATVVRSVLTGIHLASRASHPLRVFANLDGALNWYDARFPTRKTAPVVLRESMKRIVEQQQQRGSA